MRQLNMTLLILVLLMLFSAALVSVLTIVSLNAIFPQLCIPVNYKTVAATMWLLFVWKFQLKMTLDKKVADDVMITAKEAK